MSRATWESLRWTLSTKGHAIRSQWNDWHVSVYQRPNENVYRFRIDGALPGAVSTKHATRLLWDRVIRWLPAGRSERAS